VFPVHTIKEVHMMNKRIILCCLLVALATGHALTAGGRQATTPTPVGVNDTGRSWERYKDTPVTLEFFHNAASAGPLDNMLVDRVRQETGVTLSIEGSGGPGDAKLNLLIATNDLPDFIAVNRNSSIAKELAERGMLWSVSELARLYAPQINDYMSDNFKLAMRLQFNSEEIYALPAQGHIAQKHQGNSMIRMADLSATVIEVIWEEFGRPNIYTPDDLLAFLRQAKARYPEMIAYQSVRASGLDPYGLPAALWATYGSFGLVPEWREGPNGYFGIYENPNFLAQLKFVNTLYTEGLMAQTEFTSSSADQLANLRGAKVIYSPNNNEGNQREQIRQVRPEYKQISMHPFVMPGQKFIHDSYRGGVGDWIILIPKTTRHPERAIALAEYFYEDRTQAMLVSGAREGIDWYMLPDGFSTRTSEGVRVYDARQTEPLYNQTGANSLNVWRNGIHFIWSSRTDGEFVQDESYRLARERDAIINSYYGDLFRYNLVNPLGFPADSEEVKIWSVIKEYVSEEVLKILVGRPENVEPAYKAMLIRIREMGLDRINAFVTQQYRNLDSNIAKYKGLR